MAEDSQEMVDEFFDWFEHLKSKFKTKYIGKCIFEIISIRIYLLSVEHLLKNKWMPTSSREDSHWVVPLDS